MSHWSDKLVDLGACRDVIEWARTVATAEHAWETCPRGDWLLWFAVKLGVDRRLIVRASCACARTSLEYVPAGEDRPRIAIETAEAWSRGDATIEQVRAAAYAAYDAAIAVATTVVAYTSYDAVSAYPNYAAAFAVTAAADTAAATDNDAYVDVAARAAVAPESIAARARMLQLHANLVRGIISLQDIKRNVKETIS